MAVLPIRGMIMKTLIACLAISLSLMTAPAFADRISDLTTAAKSGDAKAQLDLAKVYLSDVVPDLAKAETWLTQSASAGNAEAQYHLARLYDQDSGLPKDATKATRWYKAAAGQNYAPAIEALCRPTADMMLSAHALPYCLDAAETGSVKAQLILAAAYTEGWGVVSVDGAKAQAYREAVIINPLALPQDVADAQINLAHMYFEGEIIPADYVKARLLYQKHLVQNPKRVILQLASLYEKGLGVEKDLKEAERLYYAGLHLEMYEAHEQLVNRFGFSENYIETNSVTPEVLDYDQDTSPKDMPPAVLDAQLFTDLYPEAAVEDEVEGSVTIFCRWDRNGHPENCVITNETPRFYGFGAATIKAISLMKINDQAAWIAKTKGKNMCFRFKWAIE